MNLITDESDVEIIEYEDSYKGMIQSWVERFSEEEATRVDKILHTLYNLDKPYFNNWALNILKYDSFRSFLLRQILSLTLQCNLLIYLLILMD